MATESVVVSTSTDPVEPIVTPPEGETPEQKLERLMETNKKLYERVKEAEPLAKEYKKIQRERAEIINPEKPKIEDEVVNDVRELKQIEKKRQFGYRNSLSPEETDLLFRFAGDREPTEAMKDEDFKDLLDVRRRRARVADAVPSGTNRNVTIEGKTWKDMNPEERQKNWKKRTGQE